MNKKVFKVICIIGLLGLFVYLILNTDFNEIIDNVKQTTLSIILLLIGLQIFTQLLLGVQWNRIT